MGIVKKLLLGVAILGIACLAGSKVVRAAVDIKYEDKKTASGFTHTLSWGDASVKSIGIDGVEKTVSGTSISFDGLEDLESYIGQYLSIGENELTVVAYDDTGTELATADISVSVYEWDCTVSGDHGDVDLISENGAGLLGETYTAAFDQDDEFALDQWSGSDGSTRKKVECDDLEFGVSYSLSTTPVRLASVTPTTLAPLGDGETKVVVVELSPDTASFDGFRDCDVTNLKNVTAVRCDWYKNSHSGEDLPLNWIEFDVAKAINGTFDLTIDYYGIQFKQGMSIKVSSITLTINGPSSMEMGESADYQLVVDPASVGFPSVDWKVKGVTSAVTGLADGKAVLTAGDKPGTVVLSATMAGKTATKSVTILNGSSGANIDYIDIDDGYFDEVAVGKTATYSATIYLTNGKTTKNYIDWSVSDTSVATIDAKGKLTAKKEGEVVVTATAALKPSKTDSVTVTIKDKIDLIDIDYPSANGGTITISKGYALDLNWDKGAVGDPRNASVSKIEYTVESGNKNDFTVSGGKVTAKAADKKIDLVPTVTFTDKSTSDPGDYSGVTIESIADWATAADPGGSNSSSSTSSDYTLGFYYNNDEVYTGFNTKENLTSITKYRIEIRDENGKTVVTSDTYDLPTPNESNSSSNKKNISKDTLNSLLKKATGLSGDSPKVSFYVVPYGQNQEDGSNATNSTAGKLLATRTVYKSGDGYQLDKSSSSSSSSSSSMKNPSGAGSDLDKVPKTGEGNMRFLIIMIAIISACIAASILLSYLPAKNGGKAGDDTNKKE
ncbi:MAG: Ig-like domain-containing protein [Lachnospiraceae bacterium]|nr:Ig-like domain-containing protein [Lachnospiraceae bacterium]